MWVIASTVNFLFAYIVMYRFTFRQPLTGFFAKLCPQFVNSAAVLAVVVLAVKLRIPTSPILQIIWIAGVTLLATLFMGTLLHQYNIKEVSKKIAQRFHKQG